MAPITSFVQISATTTIPLRIFINRKAIMKTLLEKRNPALFESVVPSNATASHKSIVRLRKAVRIRLSNSDIRKLVNSIREPLMKILFENSIENLIQNSIGKVATGSKKVVTMIIEAGGWICNAALSLVAIEAMRNSISGHGSSAAVRFGSCVQLLIRSSNFETQSPDILIEEEEDSMFPPKEDTKKAGLKYDYNELKILGKGIDLYVISRPNN